MNCYICGRRRVAVARYRMICLVLLTKLIISLFWLIGHQKVPVMLQPTQRKMSQQQKKILQREPLSNDSQATDDDRTAENQGNHWYRLTGNRRCQNSWKSRQPLISTYRQQTMPEQLKIKATTDIDLQATDDARTAENIKATTDIDLTWLNVCLLSIIIFEPCEIEIWYLTCILN